MKLVRLLVLALLLPACGATFDMVPEDAARIRPGARVRTKDGAVEEIPENMRGRVRFVEHVSGRVMTPPWDARGPMRARWVDRAYEKHAEHWGWDRAKAPEFEDAGQVRVWGHDVLVAQEGGAVVAVPLELVSAIEITDVDARSGEILGIVLGSVLGGAAVAAGVLIGISQSDISVW